MDIGTGLTILGTALGGKDIIIKMLGPTADYVGNGLKSFTEKRVENVQNIFKNAAEKIGDKINEKGTIPPKVLKGILEEGSYADDFLSVEYFGGVLASSRSGISRDDRGAFFNALISRMSTYQLRMHYVFYQALKQNFNGENINWGLKNEREKLRLYIPFSSFIQSMDFTQDELVIATTLLDHTVNGLLREQLIDDFFQYGPIDYIKKHFPEAEESGIILQPNRLGFELFYWAFGKGQESSKTFFDATTKFKVDEKIIIEKKIRRILTSKNSK